MIYNALQTILTPEAIDRLRDLLALGPMGFREDGVDVELANQGLAAPFKDTDVNEDGKKRSPAVAMASLSDLAEQFRSRGSQLGGTFLVVPTEKAKCTFYNRSGGIRSKWWKVTPNTTFAQYMGSIPFVRSR